MHAAHYTKRDFLFAALTALLVLILGGTILTGYIEDWGDDYAAYLNQAFALVDGNTEQQLKLNTLMHPTLLPNEVSDGELIYTWGFPLLEAAVYRLVGFDRIHFFSGFYYKFILLISVSLTAGILVLFFRRRFSLRASVIAAFLFCLCPRLLEDVNRMYGDLVFLCFSMLSLLLAECFVFAKKPLSRVLTGLFYALSLWYTYELRLNGFTVVAIALIGHVFCFLRKKVEFKKSALITHLFPYVLMLVFMVVCNHFILPKATSNMSDLSRSNFSSAWENLGIVLGRPYVFFDRLIGTRLFVSGAVIMLLAVLGLCVKGVSESPHLAIFWLSTLVVLVLLPYNQGIRYLYNVLPVMLLFALYGLNWLIDLLKKHGFFGHKVLLRRLGAFVVAACLISTVSFRAANLIENTRKRSRADEYQPYSDYAIDMYHFISNFLPEDAVLAFGKPRVIYLNTQRVCFYPGINDHSYDEADYYIIYSIDDFDLEDDFDKVRRYQLIWKNKYYEIYDLHQASPENASRAVSQVFE